MGETTRIACKCGQTRLEVEGKPIKSVECCCTSCREAADRMQRLEGAPRTVTDHGTTPFVMYRKDRVRFLAGADTLAGFRLSPEASSRRVIATCCNTPVYLEFKGGHWLSFYSGLWPAGTKPAPTMRTMTSDLPEGSTLPDDIPNAKKHSLGFFAKLFGAWVAMGFRSPKTPNTGEINV
ncbi:conserved hypothetical protein [Roseovarius sp. EC-HK134]|uniref:GFA family protein n=1 Tax=unclassified Roseovarius TaxID=2614913 RepID=UPI0012549951|nr:MULTISPECIES: hypothetical protein [unclassified Roseovarius]VVT17362.1 conserved hypothetical protein [Roseovarius sp. EC-HK134]VVT17800.1 conserved hypothetical protein [Roseovarius sp. EC-SD190]